MQRKKETLPSNNKKIVGIIAALVALGLLLVIMANTAITLFAGARAFVDGAGIWTKAQKQASLNLVRYVQEAEEEYFERYDEALEVSEGYEQAREELTKENPDTDKIRKGIERGRTTAGDVDNIIWVYKYFGWTPSMEEVSSIWQRGQETMGLFRQLGQEIHHGMESGNISQSEKQEYIRQIYDYDAKLSKIEDEFSSTIGQNTIYLGDLMYWSSLGIGFLILIIGGFIAIRVTHSARAVKESEQKFRSVLEHTKDVIYHLDLKENEYVYMSPSVHDVFGYSSHEVLEKGPGFLYERVHPKDKEKLTLDFRDPEQSKPRKKPKDDVEFRFQKKNGDYIWINNKRSIVYDEHGEADYMVGNARDISERKEYQRTVDQALNEKKVLLQEIHHRVKNNLAVISGLLYLQTDEVDEPAKSAFIQMSSRINSVAMVHEKLYGSESLSEIDLAKYIDELTDNIEATNHDKNIRLIKNLDSVHIDIDDAVSFGLTINELVNNAYKHAFKKRESGEIRISLIDKSDKKILIIADNGQGLPDDFYDNTKSSLGMTLVNSLLQQTQAKLEISEGEWTEFIISFSV